MEEAYLESYYQNNERQSRDQGPNFENRRQRIEG
jgi:hypothetical protein